VVRQTLWPELGFSRPDRELNIERLAWIARLAKAGAGVLVAAIAPFAEFRARAIIEEHAIVFEVYVATPLAECIRRDPKGLYARAMTGEIPEFTGDAPIRTKNRSCRISRSARRASPPVSLRHSIRSRLEESETLLIRPGDSKLPFAWCRLSGLLEQALEFPPLTGVLTLFHKGRHFSHHHRR
jgi:adenylylsulfate kinase-like enzyme